MNYISFKFFTFNVLTHSMIFYLFLSHDYVEVYDGMRATDNTIGRFCQPSHISVTSTSNTMRVKFRSGINSGARGGFHVRYFAGAAVFIALLINLIYLMNYFMTSNIES